MTHKEAARERALAASAVRDGASGPEVAKRFSRSMYWLWRACAENGVHGVRGRPAGKVTVYAVLAAIQVCLHASVGGTGSMSGARGVGAVPRGTCRVRGSVSPSVPDLAEVGLRGGQSAVALQLGVSRQYVSQVWASAREAGLKL